MRTSPVGPDSACILLVGEAPGQEESNVGVPFVGLLGKELTRMLHEAGIMRESVKITNVCHTRPPGNDISQFLSPRQTETHMFHSKGKWFGEETKADLQSLFDLILSLRPKVIVPLGETALWAVTGHTSISKWRGSVIPLNEGTVVIPTYHPAVILRMWPWRFIAVHDLRRAFLYSTTAVATPPRRFTVRPTLEDVRHALSAIQKNTPLPLPVSVDIETRAGRIDCIGFCTGADAICIPFETMDGSPYWTVDEALEIVLAIREILRNPNTFLIGQNWLYDAQYIARHWGVARSASFDTMIAHAVCFPALPKSLDFLSSLYLEDHLYWKDDIKEANKNLDDDQRWTYNCEDTWRTYRIWERLEETIDFRSVRGPFAFEMALCEPVLFAMLRGVRANVGLRSTFAGDVLREREELALWFSKILPDNLKPQMKGKARPWYDSPIQLQRILYEGLSLRPVKNRKTGNNTADDDALQVLAEREPLLRPIVDRLTLYRTLGVFYNTFISAKLDVDKRYRCSYNPVGTETFRFSSSADVFGMGTNLQNLPRNQE